MSRKAPKMMRRVHTIKFAAELASALQPASSMQPAEQPKRPERLPGWRNEPHASPAKRRTPYAIDAMSLLLLTLTSAKCRAARRMLDRQARDGRVRDNVGHQGEELVYRLVAAGLRQAPPRAVYWPWPILPWSREVLEATLPDVEVASGDGAEAPKACLKE